MNEHQPGKVSRSQARSGGPDHSEPVVLHESSRSRVELVAFYIARSEGEDFSVKIKTYAKRKPPESWVDVEEKSVSLNDSASRRLLKVLSERLAIAGERPGTYITIPVSGSSADLSGHDPRAVASALGRALAQPGIVSHLSGMDLGSELTSALKGAVRLSDMRTAMSHLRSLLDSGECEEQKYQKWCEAHSWAFGNAYVMRDEVRNISAGDSLDLLLPTVVSGYREIVELKRPNMDVLRYDSSHRSFYFSSDVSKAIGQCHRYIDVLHEAAAKGLRDHPEVIAYHPRAIIVIGRSKGWSEGEGRALHGLNHRLSGVVVMTYDQLLSQGERLIEIFTESAREQDEDRGS